MTYMINRLAPVGVILLSAIVLAGCSAIFGNTPRQQADQAISNANESISEHNRLFDKARATYADVKQKIAAGDDPSKEKGNITGAKNDLKAARSHLQDAREALAPVDGLDVDPAVKRYASLLSEAMQDQLDAEAKEIEFYGILEQDPALKNSREKALDLLSKVSDGYKKAGKAYGQAQDFANAHPKLIKAS